MITAVDTNVLLDVISQGTFALGSSAALADALDGGSLVISEPAYAELAVGITDRTSLTRFLMETGIRLESSKPETLHRAGAAWREYLSRRPLLLTCPQCGTSNDVMCSNCSRPIRMRQHVIADFLIGAHAEAQADRLLTRDRGMYARYFPSLILV